MTPARPEDGFADRHDISILVVIAVFMFHGCWGGGEIPESAAERSVDCVSATAWEKLSRMRIFFGHQSVGADIMHGVDALKRVHPGIRWPLVETIDPSVFRDPVFAHAAIGRNEDPDSKSESFERLLDSGIGRRADIAFYKYCYVDVVLDTDIGKLFETYRETVQRIKTKYPGLTLVHVTIPLTSYDDSFQSRVKGFVKHLIGKKDSWRYANIARHRFNEQLRKEYGEGGAVFDLAAMESYSPSGERITFSFEGQVYPSMHKGYTNDGGHLNETGKRIAAARLLNFLAGISQNRDR